MATNNCAEFFALLERACRVGDLIPDVDAVDLDDPAVRAELKMVLAEFSAAVGRIKTFGSPHSVNSPVPGDGGSVPSTAYYVTFARREKLLPWRLEGERADAKSPATRHHQAAPPSKTRRSRMPMRCIGPDL
jgi:hypothetical protein